MSALDLPPGIGLEGASLGTFRAPRGARRLAGATLGVTVLLALVTWYIATRHPWHRGIGTQLALPLAFIALAVVGAGVRSARITITRDGVRWGWRGIGFLQSAARIRCARVFRDGVTLETPRGSWWFLSARDWDRFDALVRQLRRAELPTEQEDRTAPLRARMQSYGRFLDGILVIAMIGSVGVLISTL